MGEENSSITRVWPVFHTLLNDYPSGAKWLNTVLRMAPGFRDVQPGALLPYRSKFDTELPFIMTGMLGDLALRLGRLRACFEVDYPPPEAFLYWLIDHASSLR
jgi:hypothetical protein